ncbi:MAG: IreB family regulatory phosphoprotein [Clostridia bacterium]|nr:IreB family regulatory phosphoprotein [Clostridia bacterium]
MQETMMFKVKKEEEIKVRDILAEVQAALKEKGYNPINQLIGYLLSGDPAYITSHKGARDLIRRVERDEIIRELLESYLT